MNISSTATGATERTPRLRLELFGGPVLWLGTSPVKISPFQAALLSVVFAAETERVPRDTVQKLLWDVDEDAPIRHRLSQLVYQVNRNCDAKVVQLQSEHLSASRWIVACDLDDFERMIRSGQYQQAYEMVERGFLSALTAKRTPSLSEWLDEHRLHQIDRLRKAAAKCWETAQVAHDWNTAQRAAKVLLRMNPREELVLRRVMRAHAMSGRVREAESTYRAFAERVALSGKWVPEPATLRLLKDVRTVNEAPARPDPNWLDDRGAELPLVGRNDVLIRLSGSIHQKKVGRPWNTIAVSGDAGLGKTRLVQEVIKSASLRGYRVVPASSVETETEMPLGLLLEALDKPWVEPLLRTLNNPWRSMLGSLFPKFQVHRGARPPATNVVISENIPRQVCEAFQQLFANMESRTILFLDNFHWADVATVRVLQFLARKWERREFTLLLAFRPEELHRNPVVQHWVDILEFDPGDTVITLDRLDDQSALQLTKAAAGERNLPDTAIDRIVAQAGGNPRFLVDLAVDSPIEVPRYRHRDQVPVPTFARRTLTPRMRGLGIQSRRVVSGLSVLARPATLSQIIRLTDCDRHDCVEALEDLECLGLVDWADGGARMRHEVATSAVYEQLSPARRSLLHARTAELLRDYPESRPFELVSLHYFWAGNHDMAYLYATEAVKGAARTDVDARLRLLRVAYDVSLGPKRSCIAVSLSRAHYRSRQLVDALRFGEVALSEPDALEAAETDEIRLIVADTRHRLGLDETEAALSELAEMEESARRGGKEQLWAAVLDTTVQLLDRAADRKAVVAQLARIGELEPMTDPAARSRILATLSAIAHYGDPEAGVRLAREAAEVAREAGLKVEAALALQRLAAAMIKGGLLATGIGRTTLHEARGVFAEADDRASHALLLLKLAEWHAVVGDHDVAEGTLVEAEALTRSMDCPEVLALRDLARSSLAAAKGNVAEAVTAAVIIPGPRAPESEDEQPPRPVPVRSLCALSGLEGIRLLEAGKLARASQIAEHYPLEGNLADVPLGLILFHSRLRSRVGDSSGARKLLQQGTAANEDVRPAVWLRLALELVRLARRGGSPQPELAEEARARAAELGLTGMAHEFLPFCAK